MSPPPRRSLLPSLGFAAVVHGLVLANGVTQGPPRTPRPLAAPVVFDLAQPAGMPGAGLDRFAGPAGVVGGSVFGEPGGVVVGSDRDPTRARWASGAGAPAASEREPAEPSTAIGKPGVLGGVALGGGASSAAREARQAALRQLWATPAPEGVVPAFGSPSGLGGGGELSGAGTFGAAPVDPAWLLWRDRVRDIALAGFHPLPSLTRPEMTAWVRLEIEPETGSVIGAWLHQSSGSAAFDQAALRAVSSLGRVPAPPSAEGLEGGILLKFVPPGGRGSLSSPRAGGGG